MGRIREQQKKAVISVEIKEGDKFMAVIKKGPHSKTLGGEEGAGRRIGPFVAELVTAVNVRAGSMEFCRSNFGFVKIGR